MSRHRKDAFFTRPDTEREEPTNGTSYEVIGQPIPQPVFYQGRLVGWKVPGEKAIFPVSRYRTNPRLFDKT